MNFTRSDAPHRELRARLSRVYVFQKLPWGALIGAGALNTANLVFVYGYINNSLFLYSIYHYLIGVINTESQVDIGFMLTVRFRIK